MSPNVEFIVIVSAMRVGGSVRFSGQMSAKEDFSGVNEDDVVYRVIASWVVRYVHFTMDINLNIIFRPTSIINFRSTIGIVYSSIRKEM